MADGADLRDDVGGLPKVEGGVRHPLEVAVDVWVVVFAHDAEDLVPQGEAVGVELLRVFLAASFEENAGGAVELEHQAFLPTGPAFGRGGVGIGKGEEEKCIEIGRSFYDVRKLGDDLWIVEIPSGGGAPETQVIID